MKVYLKKEIVNNKNLSAEAISVYIALRCLFVMNKDIYYISLNQLAFELTNENKYNRYFINSLEQGVNDLINNDIIDLVDAISKTEYILDLSKLYFKDEFFTTIDTDEIHKIMSQNSDKFKVLYYFTVLIGTLINKDTELLLKDTGAMSQSYFAEQTGITLKSIRKYNNVLEELKLVFTYHSDDLLRFDDGTIKNITNTYGRYCDIETVKKSYLRYKSQYGYNFIEEQKIVKKQMGKINRSLSQKYNNMLKGKKYCYEDTKEIYFGMIELNKSLRERYYSDDYYNQYRKNLDIFKDYDFYIDKSEKEKVVIPCGNSSEDDWGNTIIFKNTFGLSDDELEELI